MDPRQAAEGAFCGRLRLGRQFRGWTQAELGEAIGVSRQHVHQLESALKWPSAEVRVRCGEVLGFEPRYFASPVLNELRDDDCHFRRRRTTPLHVRSRLLAHGTLFSELVGWLDRHLRLPEVAVPEADFKSLAAIEEAAESCRRKWGLGIEAPIDNVTRALERAGVVVATFDSISEKVDAFSWFGPRPLVIRSTDKGDAARSRFDLAHECGHLVGHTGVVTDDGVREAEADRFAGAFLLPRAGFSREFPRGNRMDWQRVIGLKERWGVSLQAIVRRAYDLRLITSTQYRSAFISINKRGWRTDGPGVVKDEPVELVKSAIAVAEQRLGIPVACISAELGWTSGTMELVSGLEPPTSSRRPTLVRLGARPSRSFS